MRLPFFYGWIIIAVTFVTMAIGVNARTAFSLFFPPIIDEFGWERGVTAGAFSFGFLASCAVSPLIGRTMDRFGPRAVMELGVALMAGGLLVVAPATAASVSATPVNRSSCPTGSTVAAALRWDLPSPASELVLLRCCHGCSI